MKIEICSFNIESAILAGNLGADRIEFCSGIVGGGLTPSYGAISVLKKKTSVPINLLVRPREGDFLYSDSEISVIKSDIKFAKEIGLNAVVIGFLDREGNVDIDTTSKIVEFAYPLEVTFHRAIDKSKDIFESVEDIISTGCTRILTSGGFENAELGINTISKMIEIAKDKIIIMPGSGINDGNFKLFEEIGAKEIHLSARYFTEGNMNYKPLKPDFGLKGFINDYDYLLPNIEVINKIIKSFRK